MKTEISRDSHQPEKRYSGVYQQQGRMLTDADWNELVDILKARLNDALKDVVGQKAGRVGGTPRHCSLKVIKTLAGDDLTLQPGHVHVDGMVAQVPGDSDIDYDAQPDFPDAPDLPDAPADHYTLYADLWERTVTHLMDERLRDKGLHGADTCTRKQAMVQVKWCPTDIDPEQSPLNPAKGDAKLSVTLLQKSTQPDPCDPCADQIEVDSKVGNTLFRVEVHDVQGGADHPNDITLKWSIENAAEYHALKNDTGQRVEPPAEFMSGPWAYEFFDETSERHLGVHLAPGFTPSRDELTKGYPDTVSTRTFVRRWDGFCRLAKQAGSWKVTEEFDRSQSGAGPVSFTDIAGSTLVVNLDAMKLELKLTKSFVAGDYWLAEVREAEDKAGSKLMVKQTPKGIEHHYLTLGTVKGGVLQLNPEADRKFAFPPLTEMTRLFMAGGDGQEVRPGQPLPHPLRVGVANGEWPVKGAAVRFEIESGGGSLSPATGIETNAHGIAECEWTPGLTLGVDCRVKATLVDPEHTGDASMDMTPPVYFCANLITADQVAYAPACPGSGQNAVHSHLAADADAKLDVGTDGYYTVKEVLDALLCHLKAGHIPYNPNESAVTTARWRDIKEQPSVRAVTHPSTVQEAIDDLIKWLESTDIRYDVPDCGTDALPTVRSSLEISTGTHKIDEIFDKLLCAFKATHLPLDRSADLCDTLKDDEQVKSVQDAINVLCRAERGSGCTVTVGKGGRYPDLTSAFASQELRQEPHISLCLLPRTEQGTHTIGNLTVSGKESLSITGHNATVLVHGQLSLEAVTITLNGIDFSVIDKASTQGTGTGSLTLHSMNNGHVVVEHCHFSRLFQGKAAQWQPLVTVGTQTNIKWRGNSMLARRQYEEIRLAAIPKRETIPEAGLAAYDTLETVWRMDPYEDSALFYTKAAEAAQKLSGLSSETREAWHEKRPVVLIDKLPIKPVHVSVPGIGMEGLRFASEVSPSRMRLAVVSEVSPRAEVNRFFELLNAADTMDIEAVIDVIHTVASLATTPDDALALESNAVGGWVTNNSISGYVALLNNQDQAVKLAWASTNEDLRIRHKKAWADKSLADDLSAKDQLSFHGNNMSAVHSMIPQDTLKTLHDILEKGEFPPITIQAYHSLTVRDNVFYEGDSSFISKFLNLSGNQFPASTEGNTVAYALGFSGVFVGSQASGPTAVLEQILHQKEQAANLLIIV